MHPPDSNDGSADDAVRDAVASNDGAGRRPVVTVRLATAADAEQILAIYNFEVENHTSTFDIVPRTLSGQQAWLADRSGAFAAVVATIANRDGDPTVVGFAALSPSKERAAYPTTVAKPVLVSPAHA